MEDKEEVKPCVYAIDAESGFAAIVNLRFVVGVLPVTSIDRIAGAHDKANSVVLFAGGKPAQFRDDMAAWAKHFIAKGLLEPDKEANDIPHLG